jgi:hypothetical protein
MGKKRTPEQIARMREAQLAKRERVERAKLEETMRENEAAVAMDVAVGQDFAPPPAPSIVNDALDALEAVMWAVALPRADHRRRPAGCLQCKDPRGLKPCPCQDGWAVLRRAGRIHAGSER